MRRAADQRREARIQVSDNLRGSHRLVSQANQQLQSVRTDDDGIIIPPDDLALNLHTSKHSLRRALLTMDALLKALEERGYEVAAGPKVTILDASMGLWIGESVETHEEPVEDHDLDGRYEFGHSRTRKTRVPSGRLTLEILTGYTYWRPGCQSTWRDTKTKRLEERLDAVVAGLIEMAGRIKEEEQERERQAELRRQEEQRRQEEAQRRAELRKQYEAEQARVNTLLRQAENHHTSKIVRELIEAVREAHAAQGPIEPDSDVAQWIEWATQQADRLDPLRPSPPSILDEDLGEDDRYRRGYGGRW